MVERSNLTVEMLLRHCFYGVETDILLFTRDMELLARGRFLSDDIRSWGDERIIGFSWHDTNTMIIKIDYSEKE